MRHLETHDAAAGGQEPAERDEEQRDADLDARPRVDGYAAFESYRQRESGQQARGRETGHGDRGQCGRRKNGLRRPGDEPGPDRHR